MSVEKRIRLGEKIRRHGFWLADALAGGKVGKFYRELKKSPEERLSPSGELQKLLAHASATTGFYKAYQGCTDIRSYPVVTKEVIRKNYDRFVSSAFRDKSLHVMKTSGTSGERFAVLQNREKRKRVLAELIYFNEQCGLFPGDKFIYFRAWYADNRRSNLVFRAMNMIPMECTSLSDPSLQTLAALLQKDRSIAALKGYATSFDAIADYFERRGFTPDCFHIQTIISGAERLDPRGKARLKKVFGCCVVSRYSNQENGILAQQNFRNETFDLNTAHYLFEFLRLDGDEPAPRGGPARVVLTDLYNLATPFIRYDTGDIVMTGTDRAGNDVITDISGRCDEIVYDTRGNKISPNSSVLDFLPFRQILQYQLIQHSLRDFTLKLEGARGVYDDGALRRFLGDLLGRDAQIAIEHTDAIPRAASGKVKRIICEYKPEEKSV